MNAIEWTQKASKQMRRLPEKVQEDVFDAVDTLASWPEVQNVKKLKDRDDYRLRVGRYRVFFVVRPDGELIIISITEVKKRDERTY